MTDVVTHLRKEVWKDNEEYQVNKRDTAVVTLEEYVLQAHSRSFSQFSFTLLHVAIPPSRLHFLYITGVNPNTVTIVAYSAKHNLCQHALCFSQPSEMETEVMYLLDGRSGQQRTYESAVFRYFDATT
jgi:hypothetical protein